MSQKVAIVDLSATLPAVCSLLLQPRTDILAVGTAAHEAGHEVEVFVDVLNGLPAKRLSEYDVIAAPVSGPNYNPVKQYFAGLKQINPDATLVAGGPFASVSPNDVLRIADVVVREEGEVTFVELLAALEADAPLDGIPGISFKRNGRVIHNSRRPFLSSPGTVQNLDLLIDFKPLSLPAQIIKYGGIYVGQVVASRGCPFPCSFCYENMLGGTGLRKHAIEPLIADIRQKRDFFNTREFQIADPNFGANPKHCREVLRAIVDADLGCRFTALCRVDIGRRPEILRLMKEAGFRSLALGIETLEDPDLASIEKRQTFAEIVESVARIRAAGIEVFGLFMLGFDDDTERTPETIVSFCKEHDICGLSMYCLTEYPGLPGRTIPRYRICETDIDYSGAHFVNTFPKKVRPSVLERALYEAVLRYYGPRAILAALSGNKRGLIFQLGMYKIMRTLGNISKIHQRRLEEIEAPYYDSQDRLREDYLRAHPVLTEPLEENLLADWSDPVEVETPLTEIPVAV